MGIEDVSEINNDTITKRLNKVVADHFGVQEETITPSSSLVSDLGADSLDLIELVMAVEEEFEIEITDEEGDNVDNISQLIELISTKLKPKNTAAEGVGA